MVSVLLKPCNIGTRGLCVTFARGSFNFKFYFIVFSGPQWTIQLQEINALGWGRHVVCDSESRQQPATILAQYSVVPASQPEGTLGHKANI